MDFLYSVIINLLYLMNYNKNIFAEKYSKISTFKQHKV